MVGFGPPPLPWAAELSNVWPTVEDPNEMPATWVPPPSKMLTWSPPVLSPTPDPSYDPIWNPAGTLEPNQNVLKASGFVEPSMKIAEWPGARVLTPVRETALPNEFD